VKIPGGKDITLEKVPAVIAISPFNTELPVLVIAEYATTANVFKLSMSMFVPKDVTTVAVVACTFCDS
jgi:hypothetical protein